MTAATGFKRLGIAIAAVVLASFAALGAMALLIPVDTVRDAAKAEIRSVTGLDLVLRGDVAVSLFPTGSISFADVTLGDDAKPMLAADRLTARLRFFPLFAGRVQIADVSLVRPRINVSFDRDGHSNWASSIDALARALGPKANRPADATSFTEAAATGNHGAQRAHHGRYLYESFPLPIPKTKAVTVTFGLRAVTEGGFASPFTLLHFSVPTYGS